MPFVSAEYITPRGEQFVEAGTRGGDSPPGTFSLSLSFGREGGHYLRDTVMVRETKLGSETGCPLHTLADDFDFIASHFSGTGLDLGKQQRRNRVRRGVQLSIVHMV